jgi:AraC-like DNA-binding protein
MGKKLKNRKGLPMEHTKALCQLLEMDEVKAENTRLKAELQEARRRTEAMLRDGVKGTAIAEAVGYSERQNFFRAFRRWYGQGFASVRRTHQGEAA